MQIQVEVVLLKIIMGCNKDLVSNDFIAPLNPYRERQCVPDIILFSYYSQFSPSRVG